MHGANMKFVDAKQAKACYVCKNTWLKLLTRKTNAALWFNKMCRIKQLKPKYIQYNPTARHYWTGTQHRMLLDTELIRSTFKYFIILNVSTSKTGMGSPCNENGEYKNYQKNNRMNSI